MDSSRPGRTIRVLQADGKDPQVQLKRGQKVTNKEGDEETIVFLFFSDYLLT